MSHDSFEDEMAYLKSTRSALFVSRASGVGKPPMLRTHDVLAGGRLKQVLIESALNAHRSPDNNSIFYYFLSSFTASKTYRNFNDSFHHMTPPRLRCTCRAKRTWKAKATTEQPFWKRSQTLFEYRHNRSRAYILGKNDYPQLRWYHAEGLTPTVR